MIGHSRTLYRTTDLDHEEWQRRRLLDPDNPEHGYIGASDVAALLGVSPYSTPFELWATITCRLDPRESNLAMRLGKHNESFVLAEFAQETGLEVETWGYVLQHPTIYRSRTNLDATVVLHPSAKRIETGSDDQAPWQEARAVVEAKFPGWRQKKIWKHLRDTGEAIPGTSLEGYVLQVQDQLSVTGLRWGFLVALCDGELFVNKIERDEALIELIETSKQAFWSAHVETDIAPPITKPADLAVVAELFPSASKGPSVPLDHLAEDRDRLVEVKATIAALDAERKTIEARIKKAMGDARVATIGEHKVTWANQSRTRLDTKALRREMPEIAERFTVSAQTRTFRV